MRVRAAKAGCWGELDKIGGVKRVEHGQIVYHVTMLDD